MSPTRFGGALADVAKLTAATAGAWAVAVAAAWSISGPAEAVRASIAAALCLTPGLLVLGLRPLYRTAAPVAAVIFGMVARMAMVLFGAVALKALRPDLASLSFAVWLGLFYVLTLAVETKLLLTPRSRGTSED